MGEIVVLASLALFVGCSQLGTPNDRSGDVSCSVCSSKRCSVSVCVLCASCLLLGCQLHEFSGAVRSARYSISLLSSFSGLLDALGGGGGPGYTCALFYSFCATLPSSKLRGKTDHGGGSGSRAPRIYVSASRISAFVTWVFFSTLSSGFVWMVLSYPRPVSPAFPPHFPFLCLLWPFPAC